MDRGLIYWVYIMTHDRLLGLPKAFSGVDETFRSRSCDFCISQIFTWIIYDASLTFSLK